MKRLILAGLALAFGAVSQAATVTYNPATGVLLYPVNFFEINSNLIVAAISGAFPGTGSGNASTNLAQGWSASQTFNGPLLMGNTNLASKISSLESSVGGKQAADPDLDDLADGSLTGSKVGSGIDDDNVSFDDADSVWTATTIGAALEEMNDSINSGVPNGTGAKVHWSQLLGVPAGFADGTDDGAGGGGGVQTNQANAFDTPYRQTFNGPVSLNGTTDVATLNAGTVIYGGIWPVANGGSGAGTYTEARTNLHVVPDVDVLAFKLKLLQADVALSGTGHVPRRISSGVVTNMTVDDAAMALLAATTAAGQRSALGVPAIAGDTFTGPVLVPYQPYNANWTNSGSNYVPTVRAIAEKIELITSGSTFFSGVNATNFTNSAGVLDFAPNATLGTGKLLRESAAGSTPALSGMSDTQIPQPGGGPGLGDVLAWTAGGKWGNVANSRVSGNENWVELFSEVIGNGSAQSLDPFASANINNGSGGSLGGGNSAGRVGLWTAQSRLSSVDQFTGANYGLLGSTLIPTNTIQWRIELLVRSTNAVVSFLGCYDDLTTNAPTDALMVTLTNNTAAFVASAAGSKTVASTTFSVQTNVWYTILGSYTNGSSASVRVFTNRTQLAWAESLSSGLPIDTNIFGFGVRGISTGAASTNGTEIVTVDRMGIRFTNPSN